ncbi:MAG: hypothetical protein FGM61_05975 [Sediminibacterium sp.]|nr:hypothetical protein [Sediminibacterium sp.]
MKNLQVLTEIKPKVANISMNEIRFDLGTNNPLCQLRGMNAVIDPQAQKDLVKISGLDQNSINRIRETSGAKNADAILRNSIKAIGNRKLNFAFDGARITRIVDPAAKKGVAMQPQQVVRLAEMMEKKGMQIFSVTPHRDGTQARIQIFNPKIHDHPQMKGEAVTIGKTIHWDMLGGTSIHDFVQRMVCSNGATTKEDGNAISWLTPDIEPGLLYEMLFVNNEEKRLAAYFNKVQKLQETLMSVREWKEVKRYLDNFSNDSKIIRNHFQDGPSKDGWDIEKAYRNKGFQINDLNNNQLANCPTPFTWWDSINALTYLGSHQTETQVAEWERNQLQGAAGKMIQRKSYDADAWMQGLPSFN